MRPLARWTLATAYVAALAAAVVTLSRCNPAVPVPEVGTPVPCEDAPPAPNSVFGTLVRFDHVAPGFSWGSVQAAEPGRVVRLEPAGGAARTVTTDAWGRFVFEGVEPGRRHDVVANGEGPGTARAPGIVLLPGERRSLGRLELRLPESIAVPVTDEAGRPIEGAVVEGFADPVDRNFESGFYDPPDDLTLPAIPAARAVTDASGRAVLPVFGGVAWTLAAHAPGKARVTHPPVRVWQAHIALPDAVPLRGRVRDTGGRPIPAACVLARAMPPIRNEHHGARYDSPGLWHRTTSDADGSFEFDALPPGVIDLLAGPPGAAPFAWAAVRFPERTTVDIEVPGLARVRGRITDAESGAPVPGVVLVVQERELGTAARCVTDPDGRYEFTAPGTGSWEYVRVVAPPGWAVVDRRAELSDDMLPGDERVDDFRLRRLRTGTVVGRVAAATHPDVAVRVRQCVFRADGGARMSGSTIVHADGRFRIDGVTPGRVALFAAVGSGSYGRDEDTWFRVQDAIDADAEAFERASFDLPAGHVVDVALEPVPMAPEAPEDSAPGAPSTRRAFPVRVRVRPADGLPLRNAWVYLTSRTPPQPEPPGAADSGCEDCRSSQARAHADDGPGWTPQFGRPVALDGVFDGEESASPGDWIFAVAADDRHPTTWARVPAPADGSAVQIEVVLRPAPVVRGLVTADGVPVPGARVVEWGECARTGEDGTFQVACPDERPHLRVEAAGFLPERWSGDPGRWGAADAVAAQVEIRLRRSRSIAGRVVDPSGGPVQGVRVAWIADGRTGDPASSDADGRFVLPTVPRAPVRLRVVSPRWAAQPVGGFVTESVAVDAATAEIVVRPALAIEGRVVRADGTAIARAEVRCEGAELGTWIDDDAGRVWTDGDGRFRIPRLAEGDYEVRTEDGSKWVTVRTRAGATGVELRVKGP